MMINKFLKWVTNSVNSLFGDKGRSFVNDTTPTDTQPFTTPTETPAVKVRKPRVEKTVDAAITTNTVDVEETPIVKVKKTRVKKTADAVSVDNVAVEEKPVRKSRKKSA